MGITVLFVCRLLSAVCCRCLLLNAEGVGESSPGAESLRKQPAWGAGVSEAPRNQVHTNHSPILDGSAFFVASPWRYPVAVSLITHYSLLAPYAALIVVITSCADAIVSPFPFTLLPHLSQCMLHLRASMHYMGTTPNAICLL